MARQPLMVVVQTSFDPQEGYAALEVRERILRPNTEWPEGSSILLAIPGAEGEDTVYRKITRVIEESHDPAPPESEALKALRTLVALKDGPRDDHYEMAKPAAWEAARRIVNPDTAQFYAPVEDATHD